MLVFHLAAVPRVNSAGETDFTSRVSQEVYLSCREAWSRGTGSGEGLCSRTAVETQKSQLNDVELPIFNLHAHG